MKKQVLLDVDTGVDDAYALLLALRSPDLEVIGITTVAGNVDVDQVTANTLKVLDMVGAPEIPVAKGMSHPLVEPTRYVPEIHGQNGLGNLNPPPSSRSLADVHAVEFLIETLMVTDEPITLIPLAPLTNIGVALRMEPRIKEKIEQVVLMGGSAFAGGNAAQWAEANIFYDPEAAHILFASGLPIVMYGWDVYVQVGFTRREAQAFLDSPNPWAQF
ncbi:MAG: nucleoside hydrolase, partial [Anaerolineae bacterium]|nr:nucleoside hydrolase [Anaerolineae bacterium]